MRCGGQCKPDNLTCRRMELEKTYKPLLKKLNEEAFLVSRAGTGKSAIAEAAARKHEKDSFIIAPETSGSWMAKIGDLFRVGIPLKMDHKALAKNLCGKDNDCAAKLEIEMGDGGGPQVPLNVYSPKILPDAEPVSGFDRFLMHPVDTAKAALKAKMPRIFGK